MSARHIRTLVLACTSVAAVCLATSAATAGGLAVREQSTYGQGSSFAGIAAGGSLSSMFWNPATMTQAPGIQTEISVSGLFPYAANTPASTSTYIGLGGTNNSGNSSAVPSGYASWQINPALWLGLSVNSPFGLSVSEPASWAGGGYGANNSGLSTYNATPSVAYRINDWISVGAGVQIQYAKADFGFGYNALSGGLPPVPPAGLGGAGWGYGFTGGITLTPLQNMIIGIGYRSGINQKLNGQLFVPAAIAGNSTAGSINTRINFADSVSAGLRYNFAPRWTALATVEWSNHSRIGTVVVYQPNGAVALANATPVTLPFQYRDGWFYSAGAEYQWTDRLTVRGGLGYEVSPVTDSVRMPLIPDNNRMWASMGSTYKISKDLSVDLAYSHIFVNNTHIDVSAASGNPWFQAALGTYIGDLKPHIDILSIALKYRWDDAAPAKTKLITK
jgi:long-chain fatty acid transport protein